MKRKPDGTQDARFLPKLPSPQPTRPGLPERRKRKIPVDELTRLAFWFAEQDRYTAWDSMSADDPCRSDVYELYVQLRTYRLKRWGRTVGDRVAETMQPTTIQEVMRKTAPRRA